jgi:hypothetical protein
MTGTKKHVGFLAMAWPLTCLAGCAIPSGSHALAPAGPEAAEHSAGEPGTAGSLGVPAAALAILGTFHFQDAGLDSYRPEHHVDVRTPERQTEVEELILRLAEFRPTRIAVEQGRFRQARLDSLYTEYLAGRWELGANEVYQLGFRLAARLGHERVYAVDAPDHSQLMALWRDHREELAAAERADAELNQRYRAIYSYADSAKMNRTLREHLLYLNDPDRIRLTHGHYLIASFKAEGEDEYLGPNAALGWYSRNLRIFRNIQRITDSPEERILAIVGSGHLALLNFFADASPEYEWVDVRRYLNP